MIRIVTRLKLAQSNGAFEVWIDGEKMASKIGTVVPRLRTRSDGRREFTAPAGERTPLPDPACCQYSMHRPGLLLPTNSPSLPTGEAGGLAPPEGALPFTRKAIATKQ